MKTALLTILILCAAAAPAGAATVAYLDGGSVWLKSDDGTKSKRLSGPTPDGRVWREIAQADNGRVIAVRREPGKIAPLNTFTLWGKDGEEIYQGSLKAQPGWSTSAFPVSLDLTADGRNVVYGYSNMTGFYPNTQFETGTYVLYADRTPATEPFRIAGWKWPTTVGDRIVTADGGTVNVQREMAQVPFALDFDPWIDTSPTGLELQRTDVSANGTVAAIELVAWTGGEMTTGKIAMVRGTLGGEIGSGDCFLPAQGVATDVSVSADGRLVTWQDDRGVVVAGSPDFSGAEPCVLTRSPVVISATGEMPSFGSASLGGDGGPGPGPGEDGFAVTLPVRVTAKGLVRGVVVKVRVAKAGAVKIVGTVGGRIVARGLGRAKGAGLVKVKLRLLAKYRGRPGSLKGEKMKLKVTAPGGAETVRLKLR
ncbi:MAG TPA: hypothetical protein VMF31_07025 [Solirubrobacterales bacterium]|nr:hypothetical protein [Solirubrobacterales bacterium]